MCDDSSSSWNVIKVFLYVNKLCELNRWLKWNETSIDKSSRLESLFGRMGCAKRMTSNEHWTICRAMNVTPVYTIGGVNYKWAIISSFKFVGFVHIHPFLVDINWSVVYKTFFFHSSDFAHSPCEMSEFFICHKIGERNDKRGLLKFQTRFSDVDENFE